MSQLSRWLAERRSAGRSSAAPARRRRRRRRRGRSTSARPARCSCAARRRRHPRRHAHAGAGVPGARGGRRGRCQRAGPGRVPRRARRREAFAMERVEGETIGRRIVRDPPPRCRARWPTSWRRSHCDPAAHVPAPGDVICSASAPSSTRSTSRTRDRARPVWSRAAPARACRDVIHGDFGSATSSSAGGLTHVLDWEFAHVGDPAEDLAWPLVRAWRFGADVLRLGGVGEVEPYLERYDELTGRRDPAGGAARLGGARQRQVGDRRARPVPPAPAGRGAQRRARDPRAPRGGDRAGAARLIERAA